MGKYDSISTFGSKIALMVVFSSSFCCKDIQNEVNFATFPVLSSRLITARVEILTSMLHLACQTISHNRWILINLGPKPGSKNARTGRPKEGPWRQMGGTVDYWQTCTCNPSDTIAYTSAWWTSFGGHRGRLLNGGPRPSRPP